MSNTEPEDFVRNLLEQLERIASPDAAIFEDPTKIRMKMDRWRIRTKHKIEKYFGNIEANRFQSIDNDLSLSTIADDDEYIEKCYNLFRYFLEALIADIKNDPEFYENLIAAPSDASNANQASGNLNDVFIIHGHDETNKYALARYIEKNLNIEAPILDESPGKGRTIIEKFEQEAQKCGFAFAVLTPDDIVHQNEDEYAQARPNVAFELGWFYGRLGRDRVCIILKEGTRIHSDLNGVSQLRFSQKISGVFDQVREELASAGLI
jgi:predicted nucleotide-binding protein